MATEVLMPQMGADMTEGTLLRWLVSEGQHVERGDPIAEIETDKANVEIEAFQSGVFLRSLAKEGAVVPVGTPIAVLGESGEAAGAEGGHDGKAATLQAAPENPAQARTATAQGAGPGEPGEGGSYRAGAVSHPAGPQAEPAPAGRRGAEGRVRASPLARRMAEEWGVDLATIEGSGPGGRVVRRDVEAAARKQQAPAVAANGAVATQGAPAAEERRAPQEAPPPPPEGAEIRPLSRIRQSIARRMTASKRDIPHYYATIDVDMTEAMRLREEINAAAGEEQPRITVNDLIIKATAMALADHPQFNALFSEGGITIRPRVNVCMAIALDDGLIAPAILDTNRKSLRQISVEARDLAQRARSGRLSPDEYTGGTLTVSNLGMYGIDTLLAIIQPNQSAILGIGAVTPRAVVREGEIVARQMMTVGLSADHRATDGAEGAQFLQTLREILEHPLRLLL